MKKKGEFSKKYYSFLFVVIFFIFLVILGICSFISSLFYLAKISNEKINLTSYHLDNVYNKYKDIQTDIDTLYSFLMSNCPDAYHFLTTESAINDEYKNSISKQVQSLCKLNVYVDSVTLYNYKENSYLCNDSMLNQSTLLNVFMKDIIESLPAQAKQRSVIIYAIDSDEPESSYYVTVLYYKFNKTTNINYCVAFNLNADSIGNSIFADTASPCFLLNEYGTVVWSNIPQISHQQEKNYISWVKQASSGKNSGYFKEKKSKQDITVSYCAIEGTGLYLFTENQEYGINLFRPQFLLLFFIPVALISLIITFLFARKLYSPIKETLLRLDSIARDSLAEEKNPILIENDEFAYVNSIVTALSEKLHLLKEENLSQLVYLRKEYLKKALQKEPESSTLNKTWEVYFINIQKSNIGLLLIKIDEAAHKSDTDRLTFEDIIRTGFEKFFRDQYDYELLSLSTSDYLFLFTAKDDTGHPQTNDSYNIFQNFKDFISLASCCTITIVIEESLYDIRQLHLGYQHLNRLLKERFVLGYGKIITQEYIDTNLSTLTTYPNELIRELIQDTKQREKKAFLNHYKNMIEFLSSYIYQDVIRILINLISQTTDIMRSITVSDQYLNMDFSSIDELFNSVHTLPETELWFEQLFEQYLQTLKNSTTAKNEAYYTLVKLAQQEIITNYHDPNLSMESVSELVGYTPSYFSKIYKNLTGVYLKDYIKNIRISHAQQLLEETNLPVSEISKMTGFINQNYFFVTFKKELGITPAVYRSQHKQMV